MTLTDITEELARLYEAADRIEVEGVIHLFHETGLEGCVDNCRACEFDGASSVAFPKTILPVLRAAADWANAYREYVWIAGKDAMPVEVEERLEAAEKALIAAVEEAQK